MASQKDAACRLGQRMGSEIAIKRNIVTASLDQNMIAGCFFKRVTATSDKFNVGTLYWQIFVSKKKVR